MTVSKFSPTITGRVVCACARRRVHVTGTQSAQDPAGRSQTLTRLDVPGGVRCGAHVLGARLLVAWPLVAPPCAHVCPVPEDRRLATRQNELPAKPPTFIRPSLFRRWAKETPSLRFSLLTLVGAAVGERRRRRCPPKPPKPHAPRGGGVNHAPVMTEPCFVFVPATLSRHLLSFTLHPRSAGNSRFPGLG